MIKTNKLIKDVKAILKADYAITLENAQNYQKYNAISKAVIKEITSQWNKSSDSAERKAYYLSAEFLMGRAFSNNLINLGVYDTVKATLAEIGLDINEVENVESDAGLGNGGLGRLAACFLDSAATINVPLNGYGIRYEYGIFRQQIENGFQVEYADTWLKYGDPWSVRRESEKVIVEFGDQSVYAIPYDTPVIGYDSKLINTLRLWKAEPIEEFNFIQFNAQDYDRALVEKNRAEDISRVLYPNDTREEGKILRLKQQYFFVSASLQDLIKKHLKKHKSLGSFSKYNAIQLNDTHPAIGVPELMRLLIDEHGMDYDKAWSIVTDTFSYTNHTILAEALEQWNTGIFDKVAPRALEYVYMINDRFMAELDEKGYSDELKGKLSIVSGSSVKMAWLSIVGSKAINGVARLHTELLKSQELNDWYNLYPEKFQNKTNGITQRRWLLKSNPELSSFITKLLGTDEWIKNLDLLRGLEKFADDEGVLFELLGIKASKKRDLAKFIKENDGFDMDSSSLYDIQIKRLHEYKRQLLNAFHILDLYYRMKEEGKDNFVKRTFIFGAKAAPGYDRAKGIIKFINEIADLVNNDEETNDRLKVIFVENYRVTYGEKLFPAADLSEQISTAGKEASGTGNMKFMLNGAPTIGTLDGANIEIVEEAGEENNFIFGAKVEEIEAIKDSYNPYEYYESVPGLRRVVDSLIDGTFSDEGTGMFKELHDSLLKGASWHNPDNYFILKDFEDYRRAQNDVNEAFKNKVDWARKMLLNIAGSGKFSSDRTIVEYSNDIWKL